jgi:hypothetical protein
MMKRVYTNALQPPLVILVAFIIAFLLSSCLPIMGSPTLESTVHSPIPPTASATEEPEATLDPSPTMIREVLTWDFQQDLPGQGELCLEWDLEESLVVAVKTDPITIFHILREPGCVDIIGDVYVEAFTETEVDPILISGLYWTYVSPNEKVIGVMTKFDR